MNIGSTVVIADPAANIKPYLWMASGRTPLQNETSPGFPADKATRSATEVYFKLISEKISIETSSPIPWFWRRIVFAYQGSSDFLDVGNDTVLVPTSLGTNGYSRFTAALSGDSDSSAVFNILSNVLFAGKFNVDWSNVMNAPINTQRVKLMYDKTTSLRSGNDEGIMRMFKRNHWVQHKLIYADQEDGGGLDGSEFSAPARGSIGDVFILDMFQSPGTADGDTLTFSPQATCYWHER